MSSLVSKADGLKYWESINADIDGMLGGFGHITKIDLQGSRNFLAKLGIGQKKGLRIAKNALEGGAGIGRVTEGLLVEVAEHVDVIEPVAKFTAELQGKKGVRTIFNQGLEDWQPTADIQYDLIWVQWCVGHLTDEQLVAFLERCGVVLSSGGVIVVKENNSTTGEDDFDEVDSNVTREDTRLRALFAAANLQLVRVELQKGFPSSGSARLLPVRMYALKRSN
ncbi:alpha-N-methyltransferase NTM1 [Lasiosphaeria hispida]|uniref:Alpha N-terminal protein methyltransferase 1 n=1 Tax=Lasiosphaeria hispida TaxID=260671 RepID=A0AAJ0HR08_9PEZI|nr:alpha-N-methyltransferase NTM1 [Lasiosphaeria hispida]